MGQFCTVLTWIERVSRKVPLRKWMLLGATTICFGFLLFLSFIQCVYLIRQSATAWMKQFSVIGSLCLLCLSEPLAALGYLEPASVLLCGLNTTRPEVSLL